MEFSLSSVVVISAPCFKSVLTPSGLLLQQPRRRGVKKSLSRASIGALGKKGEGVVKGIQF